MSKFSDWLLKISAIIFIMLGLRMASELITQILLIVFIAVVVSPIYYFLRRLHFPSWLAISTIIISMFCFTFFVFMNFVPPIIQSFADNAPKYYSQFVLVVENTVSWLATYDVVVPQNFVDYIYTLRVESILPLVKQVTPFIFSMVQQSIIVVIIVSFILCELPSLPKKVRGFRWVDDNIYDRLLRIVLDIRHYMGIKTIVSLGTGVCIYIGLKLLGIPSAEVLGLLAFVLNFVPVFGSIAAAIPAIILALINSGEPYIILFVCIVYLLVNMVFGNIIEPKLMGDGFGISPVVVLIALLVWGWILGPIGMILAIPLTLAVKSSIDSMIKNEKTTKKKS